MKAEDAIKFIEETTAATEAMVASNVNREDSQNVVIVNSNSISTVAEVSKDAEDAVLLFKIRATVLSLDGSKMLQCPLAFSLKPTKNDSEEEKTAKTTAAWDAGVVLSKSLLTLGAMQILDEIRN